VCVTLSLSRYTCARDVIIHTHTHTSNTHNLYIYIYLCVTLSLYSVTLCLSMYICAQDEFAHTHTNTYRWLIFAAGFLTALATFSRRFLPPNAVRDQHLGAIAAAQKVHVCFSTFSVDINLVDVFVCACVRVCVCVCVQVGDRVTATHCDTLQHT